MMQYLSRVVLNEVKNLCHRVGCSIQVSVPPASTDPSSAAQDDLDDRSLSLWQDVRLLPTVCSGFAGRAFIIVLLTMLVPLPAATQPEPTVADTALSERRVAYAIDARLDPEARVVEGQMRLTWRNPGQVPVDELQFHYYLNAFSGPHTTFMRESGGQHRGFEVGGDDAWGGLDMHRMAIASGPGAGTEITERLRFIRPDDANPHDSTVAAVGLPQPVAPGDSITLDVAFTAELPRVVARTGWYERHDGAPIFMVAQWFPKLGVYEVPGQRYVPDDADRGRWYTHQFHANSEFYADFGTYDVTITVPPGYRVGAVGVRSGEAATDSTRTLTYRAEDVHDFAWTASPAYRVVTDTWRHVSLRLLIQPEHTGQVDRHLHAAKTALRYFEDWIGPYPYTALTIVDAPGGAGGMEYPTLFTVGTTYGVPSWMRVPEMITVHEFGHQYFYGLLASNEAEEAWLDEGFTTFVEARIMEAAYGPGSVLDVPGLGLGSFEMYHLGYSTSDPGRGTMYGRSWEHSFGDYGKVTYYKAGLMLRTLEEHLGTPVMAKILKTYFRRWRFRHPTTVDFIAVAEDVAGEDLGWFFDAFVYGDEVVDYAVDRIRNRRVETAADTVPRYRSAVRVHRQGAAVFPVDLRVRFADGTADTVRWSGEEKWKTFSFERPARLVEAYLDPERVIWLETDRLDNRRVLDGTNAAARKYQLKLAVWLQQLFTLL